MLKMLNKRYIMLFGFLCVYSYEAIFLSEYAGTGRQACLRDMCSKQRVGSTPTTRIYH